VLGGLVTGAQAGVVSVWSLDGWYCLQYIVLQDVGIWICCRVHRWVLRRQDRYQICRWVWLRLGLCKDSCLEQEGALDRG